jgi:hypothetical protein
MPSLNMGNSFYSAMTYRTNFSLLAIGWLGFLLCTQGSSPLLAQQPSRGQSPCSVYEQEMQAYFRQYQPGAMPAMARLDQAWQGCVSPTAPMQLIYYYFKSVEALQTRRDVSHTAYLDAAHYYYDRCVPQFSYLVNTPAENQVFADLFIDRARVLEAALIRQEQSLGINPNQRYAQQPTAIGEEKGWLKNDLEAEYSAGSILDRGQAPARTTTAGTPFDQRMQSPDSYQPTPRSTVNTAKNEPYGVVGSLGSLDMMGYLAWRGQYRQVGAPDNGAFKDQGSYRAAEASPVYRAQPATTPAQAMAIPRGTSLRPSNYNAIQAPGMTIDVEPPVNTSSNNSALRLETMGAPRGASPASMSPSARSVVPTDTRLMINVMDPMALRSQPNANATVVTILEFGEPVDWLINEQSVVANSVPYVKFRTASGQVGWAERQGFVAGGTVAVCVAPTQTFAQPNGNQSRHILDVGELVVLSDTRGDWIKLMTHNGEHDVWAYGRQSFSITSNDIAIADAYHEAHMLADPHMRKTGLLRIRQMPGYATSPLRNAVEAYIQEQR